MPGAAAAQAAAHPSQVLPLALRPPLPSALRLPLPQALSPAMHPATQAVRSLTTALPAVHPVTCKDTVWRKLHGVNSVEESTCVSRRCGVAGEAITACPFRRCGEAGEARGVETIGKQTVWKVRSG